MDEMEKDRQQKETALNFLMDACQAVGCPVVMELNPRNETVLLKNSEGQLKKVVNVEGDNGIAMLYDIFRQAGPSLMYGFID